MPPITELTRIEPVHLARLEKQGIFTTGILLEVSETPTRRQYPRGPREGDDQRRLELARRGADAQPGGLRVGRAPAVHPGRASRACATCWRSTSTTFRARLERGATELNWRAARRPDGRDVVGAGPDARGGVAAGRRGVRRSGYHRPLMESLRGALAALVIGVAHGARDRRRWRSSRSSTRSGSASRRTARRREAWTGYTTEQLRLVTDEILADLVIGPADVRRRRWTASRCSRPRAAAHGRRRGRVRSASSSSRPARALLIAGSFAFSRSDRARSVLWRRLSTSGLVIAVVTVVGGIGGVLLFDQAFALFHELFFPPGSWTFDPARRSSSSCSRSRSGSRRRSRSGSSSSRLSTLLWWYGGRRARAHAAYEAEAADAVPSEVPA